MANAALTRAVQNSRVSGGRKSPDGEISGHLLPCSYCAMDLSEEFFVERFTWSQPDKGNGNIFVGNESGQANKIPGNVNLYPCAHIQNKISHPFARTVCLKYEFNSLRNQHEVAADQESRKSAGFAYLFPWTATGS
jgi:hypothetical protein